MKVCIVVEGAYPYVNGGVSSWLQQMLLSMPEIEFVVQVITAGTEGKREFKYKIPDNVTAIQEMHLLEDDIVTTKKNKKLKMTQNEHNAFESLIFGNDVDWKTIFSFFQNKEVSLNSIFGGEDFLNITTKYYKAKYERVVFSDFLWTMRSMFLPLFTLLKHPGMEADIYHAVSTGYAGVIASMQKDVYGKKMVLTEHGIYTREREEEIIKAGWVKNIYKDLWIAQFRKLSLCSYENADIVTSLFKDAKNFQIELGCPLEKTLIIPNGVKVENFQNLIPGDKEDTYINIGAVLRVTPIKDVKTLITAFSIAKNINNRLKLWIMGPLDESEQYANECFQLVEELEVKDIVFTGMVNVLDYMGKMDMIVLSSISEGQPLSILEAFSARKPVIATNVGNCRGLVEGDLDDLGNAGYVVQVMNPEKMAQAIIKLSKDEKTRQKMGEIGYQRVNLNYTSVDSYKKYKDVYLQI